MTFEECLRLVAALHEVVTICSPSPNGHVLGRLLFRLEISPPVGNTFAPVSFASSDVVDTAAAFAAAASSFP